MPQTINGIGTLYYGSRNEHARDDTCEHCGELTTLRSYDTTKFFVVVYIPLVPLGRFRVVDQCSACTQHYAVPLKEWEAQRDEEISAARQALEGDPWNGDFARALVQACVAYRYREGFEGIEAKVTPALGSDASGLAFLGSAHEYFDDPEKAEAAYRKSLALRDDPGVRETLGVALLKKGNPGDAKQFLWHLTSPDGPDNEPLLYYLVEAYQAQGKHSEADEVLAAMARKNPDLVQDEIYARYRKRVQKHLGSFRAVASPLMEGKPLGYDGTRRLWIGSVVAATVVAAGALFVWQRTQRVDVYVLNGLEKPYGVRIDGKTHELPPHQYFELSVRRGDDVFAEAVESELGWPSRVLLAVPTGFWAALFDRNTYVLNPDQTAAVVWEQTEYRENPVERQMPSRLHVGRGFYSFADPDYVFAEFPETISMDSRRVVETRDRIWWAAPIDPVSIYNAALQMGAMGSVGPYLKARLYAYPDDGAALRLATHVLAVDDFTQLAEPHLAARPLEMEWHRMYQSRLETTEAAETLPDRYREMLAADPEDGDLMYLYARVLADPRAAEALLKKAASAETPSAYALHGLAFLRLTEARFEDAMALSRRAQELAPENPDFSYAEDQALLALGRYDELISRNEALRAADSENGEHVAEAVRLYVAKGDPKGARALIDSYMHERYKTDGDTTEWKNYLESVYHLGTGQWKSYVERTSAIDGPRFQFRSELARGNHRAAITAVANASEATATDYLLAYVAARRAKDSPAAEEYLESAIVLLSQSTQDERVMGECLRGAGDRDRMLQLALPPETKSIGLAVLAERTGDERLRRLARALNFQLTFERYYLEAALFRAS